jgi:hypothetical protein
MKPKYSYCETVTAGSTTPWHIRVLSDKGKKLGGGADTPALCGRTVAWDLNVDITTMNLTGACTKCREVYAKGD